MIFLDQYFICLKKTSADVQDITDTEYWENISWKYGKDPDYKGVWDNTYRYNKGSIVNYNNTLYKAKTNIADNAAWNATSWETLTDNIDYTGMLPNRTSNAFYGESIFDPIQNIDQFSQDFDLIFD